MAFPGWWDGERLPSGGQCFLVAEAGGAERESSQLVSLVLLSFPGKGALALRASHQAASQQSVKQKSGASGVLEVRFLSFEAYILFVSLPNS